MTRVASRNAALAAIIGVAALGMSAGAASGPSTDLLVLASGPDPLRLVMSDAAKRAGARVMATADCAEYRSGLYVLAMPVAKAPHGNPAGAYRKRCTPRAGSLTALGIPAVDPSFAALRHPPVDVDGADIVTVIRQALLIRPWYTPAAEDPREGLRVEVDDLVGGQRPIERDCPEAEVARGAGYIAVACATERAADQSLFRTTVFRARDLVRLREVPRCGKPRLTPGAVACEAQSVTIDGQFSTTLRRFRLP